MSGVTLNQVIKRYGDVQVIHGVDLTIEDGEFCVFVGPSGCGKSTLLRMIAGLEETSDGQISIGARDVTHMDPAERGVAMVFQTYALYPHMTVEENMGFGLKMTGHPREEIDQKVAEASRILKLDEYLKRKPAALSGGQRQRVAIGRAIVRGPEVFLFDEPLSNLDAELRVDMRVEIARLHNDLGNTMINLLAEGTHFTRNFLFRQITVSLIDFAQASFFLLLIQLNSLRQALDRVLLGTFHLGVGLSGILDRSHIFNYLLTTKQSIALV